MNYINFMMRGGEFRAKEVKRRNPIYAQTGATVTKNYTKAEKEYLDESLFPDPTDEEEVTEEQEQETPSTTESSSEDSTSWINEYILKYTVADPATSSTTSSGGTTTSSSSTSVPQADAKTAATYKEVVDYLTSKGLSKAGAAGAAGVFMAESGLIAGRINKDEDARYGSSAGRGLGQWSNSRRKQYDDYMAGKEITLYNDLDFFLLDLNSRPLVKDVLLKTDSVEDAVRAMHLGYENGSSGAMATPESLTRTYSAAWAKLGYRPYSYEASHNTRFNYAQQAYNS